MHGFVGTSTAKNNHTTTFDIQVSMYGASTSACITYQYMHPPMKMVNFTEKEEGATPLIIAASGGHLEAVKTLIQARANVSTHANNGRTASTWRM